MKRHVAIEAAVFVALAGFCVTVRVTDHLANFAPVAAAALFGGFWLSRRALALMLPIAAMAVSDVFVGAYDYRVMAVVYAAFLFPVVWRSLLRSKLSAPRVGLCALSCSAVFFLSTNLAHWASMGMYPLTAGGLAECYGHALPFLRNTVYGDLLWSATLFGGYALAERAAALKVTRPVVAP